MTSPDARQLNKTFRKELHDAGLFEQPIEVVRAAWAEFGVAIPLLQLP